MHQFQDGRVIDPRILQLLDISRTHRTRIQGQFLGESSDGLSSIIEGVWARPDRFDEILAPWLGFEISQVRLDSVMAVVVLTGKNRHPFSLGTRKPDRPVHQLHIEIEELLQQIRPGRHHLENLGDISDARTRTRVDPLERAAVILLFGQMIDPCQGNSYSLTGGAARLASIRSASTSAIIASTIGTARGTTQGS